jgi:hypothetical protein
MWPCDALRSADRTVLKAEPDVRLSKIRKPFSV